MIGSEKPHPMGIDCDRLAARMRNDMLRRNGRARCLLGGLAFLGVICAAQVFEVALARGSFGGLQVFETASHFGLWALGFASFLGWGFGGLAASGVLDETVP